MEFKRWDEDGNSTLPTDSRFIKRASHSWHNERPLELLTVQEQSTTVAARKVRVVLYSSKKSNSLGKLRGSRFRLLRVDVGRLELEELSRISEEKAAKDREKLERMMQYGQSAACRWRLLHDYFGEEMKADRCGTCDNCKNP